MGLLDVFDTYEGQQGLGLLAAAGARSDGASFGQRLHEGLGSAQKWKAQQQAQEEAKQMQAYRAMQMQEMAQKSALERQAIEQAIAKRQALPDIYRPGSNGAPALNMDTMLPPELRAGTPTIGAVQPRQAGIDVQRALKAGYTPDEIQKLDALRNVGMNEVARTVKGMQNGREVEQQFDKFGNPVGQGMEQFRAPIEVATGDQKQFVDPYTLAPRAAFKVNQSPDSVASNQLGWANNAATLRGQDMTDARARDLNDISRATKKEAENQAKSGQVASFDVMLGSLGRLKEHPGLSRSVGITGAFPTMPGSDSANFKAELDTFQSQAFIPMVSQLKGMGALSDAEGKKLTAAVGALSPSMGEKAFRQSIDRITKDMEDARARVSGAPKANTMDALPTANMSNKGRKIRDTTTGKILTSNGMSWVEE